MLLCVAYVKTVWLMIERQVGRNTGTHHFHHVLTIVLAIESFD